jgi:hypothetical protein
MRIRNGGVLPAIFFHPCLTGKEKVLSNATGTPNFIFRMVDPVPGRQQWH